MMKIDIQPNDKPMVIKITKEAEKEIDLIRKKNDRMELGLVETAILRGEIRGLNKIIRALNPKDLEALPINIK